MMNNSYLDPVNLPGLLTAFLFVIIWIGITALIRMKYKKSLVYLLFFTVYYVYLYNVLSYTLFQYQSLIILKYFIPSLRLNGQTAANSINLTPLITLTAGDLKTSLLNILLMIPFGFGLPFLAKFSLGRVTILAGVFSALIESLQLISGLLANITFRVADINDVIFNTFGAVIGYILFLVLMRLLHLVYQDTKNVKAPILRYVLDLRQEGEQWGVSKS